jgi:hypothetical protein
LDFKNEIIAHGGPTEGIDSDVEPDYEAAVRLDQELFPPRNLFSYSFFN